MPRFILLPVLCFLILTHLSFAQKSPAKVSGINFRSVSLSSVFQLASAEKKPVFVEVYLKGCPHCEALVPVLHEETVGEFYNKQFISWKIEANSEASKQFQKMKKLTYTSFPLFLYFDSEGKLMHMATPAERKDPAEFIKEVLGHGEDALNPQEQTAGYAARFASGDRDTRFLVLYGKLAKVMKADTTLDQINVAFTKKLVTNESRTGKVGFFVLRQFVNDYNSPLSHYFFQNLATFKTLYPEKEVNEAGESIIFNSLFGLHADTYSAAQITSMREQMVVLGIPAADAANRTLVKETEAYLKAGDTKGALSVFNNCRRIAKSVGVADYAYMVKLFNEKASDQSYASEMAVWGEAAMAAATPEEKISKPAADLYYELAETYQRVSQSKLAIESASKALGIAKLAKIDLKRFDEQVKRMK